VAALLNGVRKETEFGDCDPNDSDEFLALPGMEDLPACDWHFNETLTFAVTVADVLAGQTIQLWIHTYSDVRLGPFQVNLTRARDIGVCSVELHKQVLPECVPTEESGDSTRHQGTPRKKGIHSWESPVLPFALTHVGGSSSGGEFVLGQASGHLLVKFSMNADPQAMLTRAHNSTRPLVERMADPFRQIIAAPVRWVEAASEVAHCDGDTYCGVGRGYRETDGSPLGPPILSDLPAEGWVKHQGPDGRIFWHHLSLGPPPWDRATARMMERSPINGRVAGTEEDAVLRLPSKEKPIFKEGTQVFNLDLNKGATAEGGGTSSQPLARRSSRSLEAMGPAAVSNMANGTFIRSESRPMEATGPVPVAMAKGTFVRSESRPMEAMAQGPVNNMANGTIIRRESRQTEATGPVPVAMAKGTFVRSESRPMEAGTGSLGLASSGLTAASFRQPTMVKQSTHPQTVDTVVRKGAEGSFVTVRPSRASFATQVPVQKTIHQPVQVPVSQMIIRPAPGAPTRASFAAA